MKKNKIALITGATGFIGSHLALRLKSENWNIHAVVRKTSKIEKNLMGKVVFHVYDENNNLNKIMKSVKPHVVFHLASLFLPNHQYEDIAGLVESNIKFGTELLEAMVQNDVYCFINTGTSWQYYENEKYNPVNLYAASKNAFEMMLRYYQESKPINVVNLQLYDTYGEGDQRPKLLQLLQKSAKTGEKLLMSPGEQRIDLVHIDDVVEAFILAAKYLLEDKKECFGTFAVTSGNPIKLKELVEKYEEVLGKKLNINWGGRPYRNREVMIPWQFGVTLPGWQPLIKFETGVKTLIKGC